MAGATSQKEQEPRQEQVPPSIRRPASWATVVAVAILDVTGVVFTIAATVVLALNEEADRRWWWVVGLAFGLAVLTTVFLTSIERGRRSFRAGAQWLAGQLEQRVKEDQPVREEIATRAREYRDAADASGDLAVAERLRLALAESRISRP
jgi:hypothetical protein